MCVKTNNLWLNLTSFLLNGSFKGNTDGTLCTIDDTASLDGAPGIPDYTGTFTLSCEIDIPKQENLLLSTDVNLACTEACIDGEQLGIRCWSPYEWEIPAHLQGGKHTLTLKLTTSIMPMFGNWQDLENEQPHAPWVTIRAGKYTHVGLMSCPIWKTKQGTHILK